MTSNASSLRPKSLRTLLAASVVAISLVVGATAGPASGISVVVEDEPIVLAFDVLDKPVTLTLDLPVGAEVTDEEIAMLLNLVFDFVLEKERALVDELRIIINEVEDLVEILVALLEEVIVPFLEDTLDDLIGLVVLVKENVFNVCITLDADLDPVLCIDAE